MPKRTARLAFLKWNLKPFTGAVIRTPVDKLLEKHLAKARFSVRLLRYWWAAQAIKEEARRRDCPLRIIDYGAGRGWLRRFVGDEIDADWIALDWHPERTLLEAAGYDEIHECNFDRELPCAEGKADVVVALHVFEHLPRPAFSLTQIDRALAEGGCFLAATPTMPGLLARWRQRGFRKRLEQGKIARGGHINCFSPGRWRSLLQDCGLQTDLLTGSHLVRHTGNPLENWLPWIRLNQAWGALFPSLGSEVCLRARKPAGLPREVVAWEPQVLTGSGYRPRLALASAGIAACLGVLALTLHARERQEEGVERLIERQASLDAEHFLVFDHPALAEVIERSDVTIVQDPGELKGRLRGAAEGTHIVVHERKLEALDKKVKGLLVDARIDVGDEDFYLLRADGEGTSLRHFLSEK